MKKITFYLSIAIMLCVSTLPATSNSLSTAHNFNNGKDKEMSIVSNRASGQAQVRFKSSKDAEATIIVLDDSGKILLQQNSKLSSGVNTIAITNLLTLNEGTYTVRLVANNQTYSTRLVLWK
jgi:hypothetical protein